MAITFFGVATAPADNSTNTANPTTVTPLSNMTTGDLVIVIAQSRASSGTLSIAVGDEGGQTWNAETQTNQTTCRRRTFWCRFNGTWSGTFKVTFGATTCNSAQMLVFRPSDSGKLWAKDPGYTNPTNTAVTAPSSPYTITITGQTPRYASNVTIGMWAVIAANTFGTLSGTNWVNTSLGAQYRCTSGSGQSSSFAYQIQTSAAATNNVSQNESAGTAGAKTIMTFYEYTAHSMTGALIGDSTVGGSALVGFGLMGSPNSVSIATSSINADYTVGANASSELISQALCGVIFNITCLEQTIQEWAQNSGYQLPEES